MPLLSTLFLFLACVRWPPGRDAVSPDLPSPGSPTPRTLAASTAQLRADLADFIFVGSVDLIRPGSPTTIGYRVDSLVKGVCRGRLVRLSGRMPRFPTAVLHPGSRVLVAGAYREKGAQAIHVEVVTSSGALLRDRQNSDDERELRENPEELRLRDLLQAMRPLPDIRSVVDGATALAVVTPVFGDRLPGGGWTMRVDSATWIVRGAARLPRWIRFDCDNGLGRHYERLLLPLRGGARGDTLALPCHPERLRVEGDLVPALGAPLDSLPHLVHRDRKGTLHLD